MSLANYSDDLSREFRRLSNFARAFTLPWDDVKVKHLPKWVSSLDKRNFILTQVSICRIVLEKMYLALRLSSFNPVTRVFSFVPQDQSTATTTRGVKLHLACQFAKENGIIGKQCNTSTTAGVWKSYLDNVGEDFFDLTKLLTDTFVHYLQ